MLRCPSKAEPIGQLLYLRKIVFGTVARPWPRGLRKESGCCSNGQAKKNFTTLGQIEIDKRNAFSEGKNGFQISPMMQELMVYAGQLDCYGKGHEVLKQFLQAEVSAAQVYRVTDTYGAELGKTVNEGRTLPPIKQQGTLYVEVDGSMILTRGEKCKEVKVGRIFNSSDCVKTDEKPGWIKQS
jgi:hypothetical protein